MRFVAVCLLALSVFTQASAEERQAHNAYDVYLRPQTLVRLPDGRHFNMYCTGKGSPTAILDASASRWNIAWRHIQPDFAKLTRVCAVDRAGFGFSDPGPLPRDIAAEEADLHAALAAAGIKPPYLLVGHSYGGKLVRLFAYRHPEEVAGMLLIDPGIEHMPASPEEVARNRAHTRKCAELARAGKAVPGEVPPGEEEPCELLPGADWSKAMYAFLISRAAKPDYFEANIAEEETGELSAAEIDKARRKLGDLPLDRRAHV